METKQFTQEELDQIKKLQEKYNVLGIQLVQLKLAQKNAQAYVESLKEQEQTIESQIIEVNTEEKALAKQLDDRYGSGQLDLESGVFTPNK
jgi:chromosome segregation ATPase